jgi:hypothetical protein
MKLQKLHVAVGGLLALFSFPAFALDAAITAAVTSAFTNLLSDATELSGLVVPAVIGILSLMVVIKLIKTFGHKIG